VALRLTCRTLRAAVNGVVEQFDMRALSSADIEQMTGLFRGAPPAWAWADTPMVYYT
jgi:hypothetical protein